MRKILLGVLILLAVSCKTAPVKEPSIVTEDSVVAGTGIVEIVVRDLGISDPANDKRSYYRIFIDKVEVGRTEIGLESQLKKFATTTEPNSHLLRIEKYVLDDKSDRYVKVNNIDQPRPNFIYFDNSDKKDIRIDIVHTVDTHHAEYRITKR
ncbi:MAG: hypothetical protein PF637_10075 [Spirochaetes bacterium]|jgi:hypothetical protein|nr:hypothetical protein [Spirochaetota bacterium]